MFLDVPYGAELPPSQMVLLWSKYACFMHRCMMGSVKYPGGETSPAIIAERIGVGEPEMWPPMEEAFTASTADLH